MASTRRAGNKTALWNAAVTGAAGKSNSVEVPRWAKELAIYITVNGATTITLEAGQSADLAADGSLADTAPAAWFPVRLNGTAFSWAPVGADSACLIISDFVPAYIRLSSLNSVTATAGWETSGV